MIQDIQPHEYQNAYEPMPPEKDSWILYYEGTKCLVKKEEKTLCYPTFGELETDEPDVFGGWNKILFSRKNRRKNHSKL